MNPVTFARNFLTSRMAWIRQYMNGSVRDIEKECGHPLTITTEDYELAFTRGDVAKRVVSLFPEESWNEDPDVFESEDQEETEFEAKWDELQDKLGLYSVLLRADILSGVGRFGVLLLGIGDGKPLDQPAAGLDERGVAAESPPTDVPLNFLRAFDEKLIQIKSLETDITNPRYGLPKMYSVDFIDTAIADTSVKQTVQVHWSRIIHLADNRMSSDIYGQPRMEVVYNRLLDLKKIAGGSGEMFWKGGFPGLSIETQPVSEGEQITLDKDATKEQMQLYMEGLQRYIATVGLNVKSLSVQVADPGPHIEAQLRLIAVALGCPWRILIGSEASQLASEQDVKAWNKRINRRRNGYLTPFLLQPLIDRLIAVGVLPPPGDKGITIEWPDLNTPSDQQKAEVAEKVTNAVSKYVQSGASNLIEPFHYLTLVLKMTEEEANSIIAKMGENVVDIPTPPVPPGQPPGPSSSRAPARRPAARQ